MMISAVAIIDTRPRKFPVVVICGGTRKKRGSWWEALVPCGGTKLDSCLTVTLHCEMRSTVDGTWNYLKVVGIL